MRSSLAACVAAASVAVLAWSPAVTQEQAPNRRDFTVTARDHRYEPDRLEVSRDDIVKITLHSADHPYSFVIDAYRIVKRAGAGQSVTFEFRADRPGTFPFYCNLTSDPECGEMRGTLVVADRPR